MRLHDEKGILLITTPRNRDVPHRDIPKVAINSGFRAPPPLLHQRPCFRDEDEPTSLERHLGGSSHELEAMKLVGENFHELEALSVGARAHEIGAALGGHRSRTGGHQVVVGINVGLHLQTCWNRDHGPVVRGPVTGHVTGPSLHMGAWARWRPA